MVFFGRPRRGETGETGMILALLAVVAVLLFALEAYINFCSRSPIVSIDSILLLFLVTISLVIPQGAFFSTKS